MKKSISVLLLLVVTSVLLVACASKENDNQTGDNAQVDINTIHEKVKEELGEDYYPEMELTIDELSNRVDIDPTIIKAHVAEIPMMSVHVDTFIAIEAKEGKGDEVEEALAAYKDNLISQSMQYPMNEAKVEATEVVRHGDYVFLSMLGAIDDNNDSDSAEGLEFAEKENQRVIDVINSFFN